MTAYGSDYSPASDQFSSSGFSASDFSAQNSPFDSVGLNATSPVCDPYAPQQTDALTGSNVGVTGADAACLVPGVVVAPPDSTVVATPHIAPEPTVVVVEQKAPPSDPGLDLLNPLNPLSPLNQFNPLSPWSIYNQNNQTQTSAYTSPGRTTSSSVSTIVPRKKAPAPTLGADESDDVSVNTDPAVQKETKPVADAEVGEATEEVSPVQRDLKESALAVMMRQHKIAVTCKENDLPDVLDTLREDCDDVQRVTAVKHGMDPEKASEHSFLGNLARAPIQNVSAFIKDVCHGVTEAQGKALDEIDNRLATRSAIRGDSAGAASEEKQSSKQSV